MGSTGFTIFRFSPLTTLPFYRAYHWLAPLPVFTPANPLIDGLIDCLIDWLDQRANRWRDESMNQWVNEPTNQCINKLIAAVLKSSIESLIYSPIDTFVDWFVDFTNITILAHRRCYRFPILAPYCFYHFTYFAIFSLPLLRIFPFSILGPHTGFTVLPFYSFRLFSRLMALSFYPRARPTVSTA